MQEKLFIKYYQNQFFFFFFFFFVIPQGCRTEKFEGKEVLGCLVCLLLGHDPCRHLHLDILYICTSWKQIDGSQSKLNSRMSALGLHPKSVIHLYVKHRTGTCPRSAKISSRETQKISNPRSKIPAKICSRETQKICNPRN